MSDRANLTLDFVGITADVERRLMRAQGRAFLGLAALSRLGDCTDVRPMLGLSTMVNIGDPPAMNEVTRSDANGFVVGSALREAIDGLSLLCEELWRVASMSRAVAPDGKLPLVKDLDLATFDLTSLGDSVLGPQEEIDRPGFSGKLDKLESCFGIKTHCREEAESINKARTCLTHRLGKVGPRDLNDRAGKRLCVRYRALELYVVQSDGTERKLEPGIIVEEPAQLMMRAAAPREIVFQLGDHVIIQPQEFVHMMSTLLLVGRELVRSCGRAVASRLPTA